MNIPRFYVRFCGENSPFCYIKKSQAIWSHELFGKIQEKFVTFDGIKL
jgi:hypothetical protein